MFYNEFYRILKKINIFFYVFKNCFKVLFKIVLDYYFGILNIYKRSKMCFVSFRNLTISPLEQIKKPLVFLRKLHVKLKFSQSKSTRHLILNLNLGLPTYVGLTSCIPFKFTYLRKQVNLCLSLILSSIFFMHMAPDIEI